jgi:dihydrofolate reductase
MTRLSVFIASSTDGYIATTDDRLDWLEAAARPGEDYGYDDFMATVDAMAMGRGTYDHIGGLDPLPFGARELFVFTHRPPAPRDGVTFWESSPRDALAHWEAKGLGRVYVDGGTLISSFLAEGLIDDFTLTKIPLLLGEGRPLFHPIARATDLRLDDVRSFPSGIVNLHYSRVADEPRAS